MYKRVSVALFVLLAMGLGACGGDDDDSAAFTDSCTAKAQSMPMMSGDPCPQTAESRPPSCPAGVYDAIATCGDDGKWKKGPDGSVACACVPKGGTAGNMAMAAVCGNNKREGMEQCDGMDLKNETCGTLNPGSSGMLSCSASTCRFDTTMCKAMAAMTGQGGDGASSGASGTGD